MRLRTIKIVDKVEGHAPREWVLDCNDPPWEIAYHVEKATDLGWWEFYKRFLDLSPTAWRAMIWALRKQDEARLPLDAVKPKFSEYQLVFQCFVCEEWEEVDHECDLASLVDDDEPEPEPEPDDPDKKAKRKKAATPGEA